MTDMPHSETAPRTLHTLNRVLPHLVALGIIGGLAIIAAVVTGIAADQVYVSLIYPGDALEQKASLGAWSNILLMVGIVSSVGAVVLAGVLEIARRLAAAIAP